MEKRNAIIISIIIVGANVFFLVSIFALLQSVYYPCSDTYRYYLPAWTYLGLIIALASLVIWGQLVKGIMPNREIEPEETELISEGEIDA